MVRSISRLSLVVSWFTLLVTPLSLQARQAVVKGSSDAAVVNPAPLVHTTQLFSPDEKPLAEDAGKAFDALLDQLSETLRSAKSSLSRVVKLNIHLSRGDLVGVVEKRLAAKFPREPRPAVCLSVGTSARPKSLMSLDAVALAGKEGTPDQATLLQPGKGPASAAVLPRGPVYYISGQAERGKTLAESTRLTLQSLAKTLTFLKRDLSHAVQIKCFVHPMEKIAEVEKEIATFFSEKKIPPVVLVEWTAKDSIEIEMIVVGQKQYEKEASPIDFLTPPGMTASPVFCRVTRINHGKRIYISCLIGEGKTGADQVKDVFTQLQGILKKTGSDLRHLAKATYLVSTDEASSALNRLRPNYYDPKRPPAASKASQRAVFRRDSGLCIDMIAVGQ